MLGVNNVAQSFVAEGIFSNDPSYKGLGHDPEKAKKLLADAGFPGGKGLPPLTISFREQNPDIRKTCEVLKEQLSAVGVTINLNEMEWGAFLKQNTANKAQAFHMRWSADYLDPQDFLSLFLTTNGTENHTGYSNPQVDALCKQADAESDQAKANDALPAGGSPRDARSLDHSDLLPERHRTDEALCVRNSRRSVRASAAHHDDGRINTSTVRSVLPGFRLPCYNSTFQRANFASAPLECASGERF